MQSFSITEWKELELQITQTIHHLRILDGKMSKFNTPPPPPQKNKINNIKSVLQIYRLHKLGRTDGRTGGEDPLLDLYFAKATHVIK